MVFLRHFLLLEFTCSFATHFFFQQPGLRARLQVFERRNSILGSIDAPYFILAFILRSLAGVLAANGQCTERTCDSTEQDSTGGEG